MPVVQSASLAMPTDQPTAFLIHFDPPARPAVRRIIEYGLCRNECSNLIFYFLS